MRAFSTPLAVGTAARSDAAPTALGNTADLTSPEAEFLPAQSTTRAWRQRSYAREILFKSGIDRRLRYCGTRIARNSDGVGVYARPDRAYGRVKGVCVCGQSLACPVCAPRIAAFRAAEIAECYRRATDAGYEANLLTFTIPHGKGTRLGLECDLFGEAWQYYQGGKRAASREGRSLGNHVGREVTFGEANGWNYHHHQLRYDEPGTFDPERCRDLWLQSLGKVGRMRRGAKAHSFDSGLVNSAEAVAYVAKLATSADAQGRAVGSEIASSATKGQNLATLLNLAMVGDERARQVWIQGVVDICSRKISSVRWSRGLRGVVGLDAEKSDVSVAVEESLSTDQFLGCLTPMQWRGIVSYRAEFCLVVAANQGAQAVNNFLAGLQLGQLNDDARPAVVVPLEAETCYTGFNPVAQ